MREQTDLLEALGKAEGCFISELKEMDIFYLKIKLKQFCVYDYPLEAWNDTISYLEKKPFVFADAEELCRYLTCGNGCHRIRQEGR